MLLGALESSLNNTLDAPNLKLIDAKTMLAFFVANETAVLFPIIQTYGVGCSISSNPLQASQRPIGICSMSISTLSIAHASRVTLYGYGASQFGNPT